MTPARVLVTGGGGRLGRSVVRGFAEAGLEVVSADTTLPEGAPATEQLVRTKGVEHRVADLTDRDASYALLEQVRPEAVVNLAAIAVPFSAPEEQILRTNVAIAHHVCGAAVAAGARDVVVASSPTVLGYGAPGWLPPRFPLDESTPARPWHAYGLSKLVAEQVAAMYAAAQGDRRDAVRFASFRPCYVIAPEEWAGAPTQQGHTVHERLADPALSAPALFNYVDARDVTDFLLVLLEHGRSGKVPNGDTFFVGAADALARRPLADLIPELVPGPEQLAELAAPLTGTAPAFSSAKAERLLGWRPRRTWREELVVDAAQVGGSR
ncbi:NAD-dependent epimerase/dehydratase family protein [Ornithinicoccus halotolerans]|uniref:NAD-dependent epimerase/dehydratase family protein n=1 Tax=Ornithinicoccus halotolerans TaxID=1748220 RepID=UPI0012972F68|nr:NAD(P)-dependent oxidoreductase [Ornithinicoccus halotolerans]